MVTNMLSRKELMVRVKSTHVNVVNHYFNILREYYEVGFIMI